jgi:predicted Zn-dependent peptidase
VNPVFDDKKLEIEKAKIIEGIRRRNDEPFQIARRELRRMIYGNAHPLSAFPEIAGIRSIRRADLVDFHRKYYHPNNAMIAVSGDFDPGELMAKLESALRGWTPAPVSLPPAPSVGAERLDARGRSVGYAAKSVNQASVLVGHLGVKRHNPDRFKLEVLNEILGGSGFSSRLMQEVRERQGLAYWVGSSFSEPWDYGVIAAGCQTKSKTTGKALEAILREISRIREKPVSPQELQLAKDSLINSFVFRYASAQAIVGQTLALAYFGYPPDYLETYTSKIAAVTSDEVWDAARKYLRPDDLRIVVVGDEKTFDGPLSKFGPVQSLDTRIPE